MKAFLARIIRYLGAAGLSVLFVFYLLMLCAVLILAWYTFSN
ncbi:hypothetical protein Q5741_11010 [Paenibacillus sp. JX-17]|uniref:Uncharacterized protein n=1 Tax=Paenibacillus lacisoli TaxID=3064525 RepID=A0ABT9CCG9_9BACL|nr:hypothetical protein [Paenibacillus sp. JX-17]MDO7906944.1 hypothetical protein [Paenibacillus sp. JX-17]